MSYEEDNEIQRQLEELMGHKWNDPVKWFILDDKGEPVPATGLMQWERQYINPLRKVKQEWIKNVRISTIFLGLDHAWGGGPPLLWETMTFSNRKNWNQECRRCAGGREQAEAMHAQMCDLVKTKLATHG